MAMSIQIQFTDDDKSRIKDRHDQTVADRLETAINSKNDTLQWKKNIEGCRKRFYNTIEKNGQVFPEMFFRAHSADYRAVLAWIPDEEKFVVLTVVLKQDHYQSSKQHAVLEQIYKHPRRVISQAKQELSVV